MNSWFAGHGIRQHQITPDILEMAFNELVSQHRLQLRAKPATTEQVSEASLYDMPMAELERRAGGRETNGRQTPVEYVPSRTGVRPGDFSTFEPGQE
jgi:hypothetical protein